MSSPDLAAAALDRIHRWRAAGWSKTLIAEAVQVSESTISRAFLQQGGMHRYTARRILAAPEPWATIPWGTLPPHALIPATGTRRRLQALAAAGWPNQLVADLAGVHPHRTNDIRAGRAVAGRHVHARVAEAIRDVYQQLEHKWGPGQRDPRWPVPAAWDAIDDPTETPSGTIAQQRRWRDLAAEVEWLLDHGVPPHMIPPRVGYGSLRDLRDKLSRHRAPVARRLKATPSITAKRQPRRYL